MIKNMKIGKKLIISFILVSVLASISGLVSMFVIRNMNTQYEYALVNYGFSQGDIGKAMLMISDSNRCVRDIISFTDQGLIDTAKQKIDENMAKYVTYTEGVTEKLTSPEALAQYAKIEAAAEDYRNMRAEVLKIGDTTNAVESARAQTMAVEKLDPLYDELYAQWAALMAMNVNAGNDMNVMLKAQGGFSLLLSIVICIAAITISVILGGIISRSISRPVKACADRLERLAQGDLKTAVPPSSSKDEIGVMLRSLKSTIDFVNAIIGEMDRGLGEIAKGNVAISSSMDFKGDFNTLKDSINTIIDSLNTTLSQINQASDQVSGGSDQVSSGAQALSQGATEQASSVEELAATINEISHQVKENADSANMARDKMTTTSEDIGASNKKMQQLIGAMDDISKSSQEISKVIKTIEDIAFQTNILALNAAVEAARAGAAGKGFAVVADEVRNLASKSAEAAKSTTALIEGAIQAVNNGTHLADDTAKALAQVVEIANDVAGIVNQISHASGEQAASIQQVTVGVDQISAVVQTNSATAEESAAASQELSGQASMLKSLVSRFKLRNDTNLRSDSIAAFDSSAAAPTHALPAEPHSNTAYSLENY